MTKILMLDPTVTSKTEERPATARLETLDDKTVGLYSNTKLNANKVLEIAAELISERFKTARFVLVEDNIDLGHDMSDEKHWKDHVDVALVAVGD